MALPIGVAATETQFADGEFTVAAGSPATLFITGATTGGIPSGVNFEVALKNASGTYTVLWILNAGNVVEKGTVVPPATYAVRRLASSFSAGLELKA